jgi:hypothetical protein
VRLLSSITSSFDVDVRRGPKDAEIFVGHLRNWNVGNVDFGSSNQKEQQVERALEGI